MLAYLWGIETNIAPIGQFLHCIDVSLPMRIETQQGERQKVTPYRMLAYLWGIETHSFHELQGPVVLMLAYLWGIETMLGWPATPWP